MIEEQNKDVLEYTEEELQNMSTEELQKLLHEAEEKESLFNTSQLVQKTLINSLYGALANKWFPLFNEQMAAAITGNGRYFIRKSAQYIEEGLQKLLPQEKPYIVYGDTDSYYYHIEPFMERYQEKNPGLSVNEYVEWADQFEKKVIQPMIQKSIDDFASELNAYNKEKIGCEREAIADSGVFCQPKKYYLRVRDDEGTRFPEDAPYFKKMGLEVIKSSTPTWSKKYLEQAIPHILDRNEDELRDWINQIKDEFTKVNLNEIASVSGVSRLDYNLGDKGVPIGARAALIHNNYIESNNLGHKYAPITAGEKCKRLYLLTPNKFNSNIIAFTNDEFVQEIDCVDYDTQFEKMFLKPMELMVDALQYDLKRETESLDDW